MTISKQLISVPLFLLALAACSGTDEVDDGSTSTGGNAQTGTGGSGGSPSTGGASTGGSVTGSGGGSGGAVPSTGGAGGAGTGGTQTGGTTGSGGANNGSGGADTGAGGDGSGGSAPGSGGDSGQTASFQCDNLSLSPSMTGVAKPSGAAGGLKVLDWAGFVGAASFTFDDNWPSQMDNYDALKATGGHFTWFVVGDAGGFGLNGKADLISDYKATIADGNEIGNHSWGHPATNTGTPADLQQNQDFITEQFMVAAQSVAAPNCHDTWSTAAQGLVFQNRGPCSHDAATVSPRDNTNPFLLPAYLPNENESADSMSRAITSGKWRIFVIHGFETGAYNKLAVNDVTTTVSQAVSDGFWVEGMTNVGAYWQGQKLIMDGGTSATWSLPDLFPPNMCVRITTTGGTVTQNGETIPWDDHGYYEISLDAGEVTIQ